jgi:signal transduction histidine kinase
VEARRVHVVRQLDQLRREVDDLRASRRRLALADDAERRDIERELHRGVQQHLVALAASVQFAAGLLGADHRAANARLDEVARDVDLALAEAQRLAQRIYPPLLDSGGLVVAIRSAAASANVPTRLDVDLYATYPPEVARAVYVCCLEVLERAAADTEAAVMVHEEGGTVAFEVIAGCAASDVDIVRLRDRVEALGGRLTVTSLGGRGTRVAGSIPLAS